MKPFGILNINSYFDEVYTEDYPNQALQRSFWRLFGRVPLIPSLYAMEQYLLAKKYVNFIPSYYSNFIINLVDVDSLFSSYSNAYGLLIDRKKYNEFIDDDYVLCEGFVDKFANLSEIIFPLEWKNSDNYFSIYPLNQVFYKHILTTPSGAPNYDIFYDPHINEGFEHVHLTDLLRYSKENCDDYYYLPEEVEQYIDNDWKNLPNSYETDNVDVSFIFDIDYEEIESYPVLSGARRGDDFAANIESSMSRITGDVIAGLSLDFSFFHYGVKPLLQPGVIKYNSFSYFVGGIDGNVDAYVKAPTKIEDLSPFANIFVYKSVNYVMGMDYKNLYSISSLYNYEHAPFGGGFNILPTYDYNEASYGYETVQNKGEYICSPLLMRNTYTLVDYDKVILNGVCPTSPDIHYIHSFSNVDDNKGLPLYSDFIIPYQTVYISIFDVLSTNYTDPTSGSYTARLIELNDETLSTIADHWYILEIYDSETGFPLTAKIEPAGSYEFFTRDGQSSSDILFLTNEYGFIIIGCSNSIDISNINIEILGE